MRSSGYRRGGILVGLLLSPQRRILFTRGCAAGVTLLLLLALPNFLWQVAHQFPTYQFLSAVPHSDKNIKLPPLAFLFEQVRVLLIASAPLWIGGLAWLVDSLDALIAFVSHWREAGR